MHNVGQCDDTAQTQENDAVPSPKRHLHAVDATCQLGLWQKLRWVGGMMHENGAWLNASSAFKYPFLTCTDSFSLIKSKAVLYVAHLGALFLKFPTPEVPPSLSR